MKKTFTFDLIEPLSASTEILIANFGVRKLSTTTIEMTAQEGETLEQAIIALNRLDIQVQNGRHSFD